MNKKLAFLSVLLASVFAGCSSDEPVAPDNSFDDTYDGQAYMRVRIAMPDEASSRADGDPAFVNGTAEEQAIKEIGLKFYNADGSFYGYGLPVQDPTVNEQEPGGGNVEGKVATAVIVLQINSNAPKPTHVVAYVNCGETWKQEGSEPNINDIDKTMPEVYTTYGDKKYYAMTSSNYRVSGTGLASFIQGYQTSVPPTSFKSSEAEAMESGVPVDLYVERLATKVKVGTAKTEGGADMTPDELTNGDYKLKFVIDGYSLGGVNHESYMVKHILQDWTVEWLWNGWNDQDKHRCYWAYDINYNNAINNPPTLDYVSYNEVRSGLPGTKAGAWMYTAENTLAGMGASSATGTDKATEADPKATELNRYLFQPFAYVIGHYEVTKGDNKLEGEDAPAYLYEYAGKIFEEDAMITHMQQTIGTVLYKKTQQTESKIVFEGVNMKNLGFIELGSYNPNPTLDLDNKKVDASLVCLQLTAAATDLALGEYYIKNPNYNPSSTGNEGKDNEEYITATRENVTPLLLQSKTQAYGFKYDDNCAGTGAKGYLAYFPVLIEHLNTAHKDGESASGYYGVVRNHCYNITINSIKGLGIGIFNPDVDIIPKDKLKPLYLAATFNVLSWRVVGQSVDL